ncbi:uncharacterized protein LOC131263348 [Anopheles coustani]|uniref:uncharacterized protein LOC131263348 n=1 Tax=Anopheles coustani TaxID=139045 RepID=UPI002657BA2E|nr:uncharacterized protein LOC131263348 [Anopheles coustani]
MKCSGVLSPLLLLLLGALTNGLSIRPRRDLLEMGKAVLLEGVSKVKEAFDHGVSMKSEGKRSVDLFGLKFGADTGVNTGFGDAANGGASENNDDLVRRKRALDIQKLAQVASLLPQTPFGTNVNIVKVSSVSNVNNFGELPPAEAPAPVAPEAARRKRTPDLVQLTNFEKKSFAVDSVIGADNTMRTHESLGAAKGSIRTLVTDRRRSKREPQSDGTTGDDQESSSNGPPKGGPRGSRGPGGPRGPPPGGCRGGPPPGEDGASTTATTSAARRKRETIELSVELNRDKRSPKGGKSASCRGGGGGGPGGPTTEAQAARRKRDDHPNSSDYSDDSESTESKERKERSILPSLEEHRRSRRQAFGGEAAGNVGSWFEQLAGVFVDTVKKVVAVTKNAFDRGGQRQS